MIPGPSLSFRASPSPTWKRLMELEEAALLAQRHQVRTAGLFLHSPVPVPVPPREAANRWIDEIFPGVIETMAPAHVEMAIAALRASYGLSVAASEDAMRVLRAMVIVGAGSVEMGTPAALPPEAVDIYLALSRDPYLSNYWECTECRYRVPGDPPARSRLNAGEPSGIACVLCGGETESVGEAFREAHRLMEHDLEALREEYKRCLR